MEITFIFLEYAADWNAVVRLPISIIRPVRITAAISSTTASVTGFNKKAPRLFTVT